MAIPVFLFFASGLAALCAGMLLIGGSSGLDRVLIGGLALVCASLAGAGVFVALDFNDADGFVDCWPRCSGLQQSIVWVIVGGLTLLVLLAVAVAVRVGTRVRGRRDAKR